MPDPRERALTPEERRALFARPLSSFDDSLGGLIPSIGAEATAGSDARGALPETEDFDAFGGPAGRELAAADEERQRRIVEERALRRMAEERSEAPEPGSAEWFRASQDPTRAEGLFDAEGSPMIQPERGLGRQLGVRPQSAVALDEFARSPGVAAALNMGDVLTIPRFAIGAAGNESYAANQRVLDEVLERGREEHPAASAAGALTGIVPQIMAPALLGEAALARMAGVPVGVGAARLATPALTRVGAAGLEGALYGLGHGLSTGDPDRATSEALAGGAFGAGLSSAAEGIGALAPRFVEAGRSAASALDEWAAPLRVRAAGGRTLPVQRRLADLPGGTEGVADDLRRLGISPRGSVHTVDEAARRAAQVQEQSGGALDQVFGTMGQQDAARQARFDRYSGPATERAASRERLRSAIEADDPTAVEGLGPGELQPAAHDPVTGGAITDFYGRLADEATPLRDRELSRRMVSDRVRRAREAEMAALERHAAPFDELRAQRATANAALDEARAAARRATPGGVTPAAHRRAIEREIRTIEQEMRQMTAAERAGAQPELDEARARLQELDDIAGRVSGADAEVGRLESQLESMAGGPESRVPSADQARRIYGGQMTHVFGELRPNGPTETVVGPDGIPFERPLVPADRGDGTYPTIPGGYVRPGIPGPDDRSRALLDEAFPELGIPPTPGVVDLDPVAQLLDEIARRHERIPGAQSTVDAARSLAGEYREHGGRRTFREAQDLKTILDRPANWNAASSPLGARLSPLAERSRELRRGVQSQMDAAVEAVDPGLAQRYRQARRENQIGRIFAGLGEDDALREAANRQISPTDYGAAMMGDSIAGSLRNLVANRLLRGREASAAAAAAERTADALRAAPGTLERAAATGRRVATAEPRLVGLGGHGQRQDEQPAQQSQPATLGDQEFRSLVDSGAPVESAPSAGPSPAPPASAPDLSDDEFEEFMSL